MKDNKRFINATWEIMQGILEEDNLEEALSHSLEILIGVLRAEAGVIWILSKSKTRLIPMFHQGPADLSGVTIENGKGLESQVITTGESVVIRDPDENEAFEGTVFDGGGFETQTMICVPLKSFEETYGCIQIINKKDGESFDEEDLQLCERMAAISALTIGEKGLSIEEEESREVLVSLREVIKEFENPGRISRVLKGINLDVYKGEMAVILGESGCGKSTMMNIIGGMDLLTDGQLLVEGVDYSHPTDKELTLYRRHYIGFIFQSFNLMPNLTAEENVKFIAEISENPMDPKDALAQVGLAEKANSFPAALSGGQQQRVAVARALVKNPKLILADEPTAALDHETSIEVLTAIEEIVKEKNTTVLMVTHNPEIGKMADRVIKLRNGRVYSIKRNLNPLPAKDLVW